MADFAKSVLLKYGWVEGKGLGKDENGIVEAIKPKLKLDKGGIGHKSETCSNWWESVFNKASQNVSVDKNSAGVSLKVLDETAPIFSNKQDLRIMQKEHNSRHKTFIKSSILQDGKLVQEKAIDEMPKEVEIGVNNLTISDNELFKACGGRTAHKGARHGLKLNGKLARIAQQDEEMLGLVKKEIPEKKVRTKKKSSTKTEKDKKEENIKKDKKRKRKAVETESEEDIIDDDNKDIAHLLNTSKHKIHWSKHQKKVTKKKINNLVHMMNKSCTLEEAKVSKSGKVKSKKKKKANSGSENETSEFLVPKNEDNEYLDIFKDITFKPYEEQDPHKFQSLNSGNKDKKYKEKRKKMDRLSKKLDSLCLQSERKIKKRSAKKYKNNCHSNEKWLRKKSLAYVQDMSKYKYNFTSEIIQLGPLMEQIV